MVYIGGCPNYNKITVFVIHLSLNFNFYLLHYLIIFLVVFVTVNFSPKLWKNHSSTLSELWKNHPSMTFLIFKILLFQVNQGVYIWNLIHLYVGFYNTDLWYWLFWDFLSGSSSAFFSHSFISCSIEAMTFVSIIY